MRFLVDMNLSPALAVWLRSQGHDAVHLREAGLHTLSDMAVFARAKEEQRIVVTFDLASAISLSLAGDATVSVILFRLQDMTPKSLIERFRAVIVTACDPLSEGAVVLVEETRLRIRRLPIGS